MKKTKINLSVEIDLDDIFELVDEDCLVSNVFFSDKLLSAWWEMEKNSQERMKVDPTDDSYDEDLFDAYCELKDKEVRTIFRDIKKMIYKEIEDHRG